MEKTKKRLVSTKHLPLLKPRPIDFSAAPYPETVVVDLRLLVRTEVGAHAVLAAALVVVVVRVHLGEELLRDLILGGEENKP